jgi:hypothetical protein
MRARTSSSLRIGWLTSLLLQAIFLCSSASASSLADTARDLAHKIAAGSGPGAFSVEITNRSSLDEKAVQEVYGALEVELQANGVQPVKTEQSIGSIAVVLSESLREFVWTAVTTIGSGEKKVALASVPRLPTLTPFVAAPQIVIKTSLLFAQEQPVLDVAVIEMPGATRLLVLGNGTVAIYRQQGSGASRWQLETSLPITHSRIFPRDLRGRLLLRRDHLFDVYLPGTFCRSSSNSNLAAPLTPACNDTDDPWPLTLEDNGVRAFFAASRNFFTGALSPSIGKIATVPPFYSATALPRSTYTLWAFTGVDGSLHLVDGTTDQLVRVIKPGSDVAAIHSGCGSGTQLLLSASGTADRDSLRAFEVPDRDPVSVSSALDFDGQIVALSSDSIGTAAVAIVKRKDTGWYEADQISISCTN